MLIRKPALTFLLAFFVMFTGCDKAPEEESKQPAPQAESNSNPDAVDMVKGKTDSFTPFYVYKDKGSRENHFNPSGFMGSVGCINYNDRWMENCKEGRTCIKIAFDIQCAREDQQWAGIYWLNPPNNWGDRKGGYNLKGAQKVTFWARGERGGEMIQEFTIGGIKGDFPDTEKVLIGPVILTEDWREYTIDLRGKDLSYISGGFSWSTDVDVNPESCTFYLDEIKFE